jgi:hypothetical protein
MKVMTICGSFPEDVCRMSSQRVVPKVLRLAIIADIERISVELAKGNPGWRVWECEIEGISDAEVLISRENMNMDVSPGFENKSKRILPSSQPFATTILEPFYRSFDITTVNTAYDFSVCNLCMVRTTYVGDIDEFLLLSTRCVDMIEPVEVRDHSHLVNLCWNELIDISDTKVERVTDSRVEVPKPVTPNCLPHHHV